jgi:hypothetical protein
MDCRPAFKGFKKRAATAIPVAAADRRARLAERPARRRGERCGHWKAESAAGAAADSGLVVRGGYRVAFGGYFVPSLCV